MTKAVRTSASTEPLVRINITTYLGRRTKLSDFGI